MKNRNQNHLSVFNDMTLLEDARTLLRSHGLRPKHSLGQNFMVNEAVLDAVCESADIQPGETIIEIGPGLGFLTQKLLAQSAQVYAYELDNDMVRVLKERFKDTPNLMVHHESALEYTPPATDYKMVANIPYYLTSILLQRHLQELERRPTRMILMVQKEVAEELTAKHGKFSILGVSVQTFADVSLVCDVPREDFYPVPNVDSRVVSIDVIRTFDDNYLKIYFQVVKAAFHNKRKQLKNNLSNLSWDAETLEEVLNALEIDKTLRPQALTIDQWHGITEKYIEYTNTLAFRGSKAQ